MTLDSSVILLVVSLGLLVLLFSRGRRQQREAAAMQAQLEPGVDVMTGSGLYATVVAVEDTVVVLETAPGRTSRWDRRAVARILTSPEEADAATAAPGEGDEPDDAATAAPGAGDEPDEGQTPR